MGVGRDGEPTDAYQPGMELWAKQTIFAEGCRGSLTKTLFERFDLRAECDVQTYGIGIKELWEVKPEHHQPGSITPPPAGRWTARPMAALSCITWKTTRWWSAL